MKLWHLTHTSKLAQYWQTQLLEEGIHVQCVNIEDGGNVENGGKVETATPGLNARWLRQHPQLGLILDEHGLSLASQGMRMQPDWIGQIARLKRAGHKNELLARACQTEQQPRVIDATAGLGHDGLLLAWLGAQVTLVERHPVLFAMLQDAFHAASCHELLAPVMQRIQLVHADSADYLAQCHSRQQQADVVYLDPMFPKAGPAGTKKQAQVKKEMQILHALFTVSAPLEPDAQKFTAPPMDLGENLLPLARQMARRVIVKRPRHAMPLTADLPQHQWFGDACRFDGYFQASIK